MPPAASSPEETRSSGASPIRRLQGRAAARDGVLPLAELRALVERNFRVYEAREEKVRGEVAAALFFVMFPPGEFDARYEAVRRDIAEKDRELLVFLRREGGEDVLFVAARPPASPSRTKLHVTLLLLTIATTVTGGAMYWEGYKHAANGVSWSALWSPAHLFWGGLTFALPLLLILGLHETAHYVAARRHGLRATLPFFIPVPPILMPIGTLGAFISLKDPLPDRKALFDVGASGPLAGFLVAVPILLLGAHFTSVEGIEVPDEGRPLLGLDLPHDLENSEVGRAVIVLEDPSQGTAILTVTAPDDAEGRWSYDAKASVATTEGGTLSDSFSGRLRAGETERHSVTLPANVSEVEVTLTWDDGLIRFGDPLLWTAIDWVGFDNDRYLTHPTFFAGWVGMLVTGINLLPASQLDGGHVARAVLGDRMRYAAYAAVAALLYLAFRFQSWMAMAIFILFLGVNHPPPLNDRTELGWKRKAVAAVVLLVFVLTFVPRPFI